MRIDNATFENISENFKVIFVELKKVSQRLRLLEANTGSGTPSMPSTQNMTSHVVELTGKFEDLERRVQILEETKLGK